VTFFFTYLHTVHTFGPSCHVSYKQKSINFVLDLKVYEEFQCKDISLPLAVKTSTQKSANTNRAFKSIFFLEERILLSLNTRRNIFMFQCEKVTADRCALVQILFNCLLPSVFTLPKTKFTLVFRKLMFLSLFYLDKNRN